MRRFLAFLEKRPNTSFLIILALLFGVIFLASMSRTPEQVSQEETREPKTSRVFPVQEAGFVTATAKVKKSGVVDIVALTPGTVQSVNVRVGQSVGSGTVLVSLTNDYGVNGSRLAAEKARLESEFTNRIFSLEKDINEKEREIAKDDDTLSKDEEKRDLKNLKLELERLKLNRETSRLDAAIANASDAVLRPRSTTAGTVEFIGVRPGENVTAGTLIATIQGTKNGATLTATLPNTVARFVNPSGLATLVLEEEHLPLSGGYLSKSEDTFGLRSLTLPLPGEVATKLTESEYVSILLPLLQSATERFIPIDAVLSGRDGSSVLVLGEESKVVEKAIVLGDTVGSFVAVKSGLGDTDEILLNRSVAPGEQVTVIR